MYYKNKRKEKNFIKTLSLLKLFIFKIINEFLFFHKIKR